MLERNLMQTISSWQHKAAVLRVELNYLERNIESMKRSLEELRKVDKLWLNANS